jgi:predicted ester cyclase
MTAASIKTAEREQSDKARRALERVCARGDFEAAQELYGPDFIDHVNGLEFRGHEGILESVGLYRAIFPDLRIQVDGQVAEGDFVTSRWTMHGTHRGRRVTLKGITISRFANGRIAEDWTASDNLDRRAMILALRWLTGRLSRGQKPSARG